MQKKNRILLFIKIPPPTTGATLMNSYVLNSELLNASFTIRSIKISYVNKISSFGKLSIQKIFKIVKIFWLLCYELLFYRPKFVYFQISPLGKAFYRDFIFVCLIKFFNVKIVYHLHGKGILQRAIHSSIDKKLYKFVFINQFIIVLSEMQKKDIEFIEAKEIFVIPNGIPDFNNINPHYLHQRNNNDTTNFLFISNLFKSKGVYDLISIAVELKKHTSSFIIDIVGNEGDIKINDLKLLIKESKLDNNVNVHGGKFGEDKNLFLKNADVFVFPTKNEAFGLVVLEAMQFSLPIVTTKEGGLPEIVDDGITGFFIDEKELMETIKKLYSLINDKKLRTSMGMAARKKYEENYTIDKFENAIYNAFIDILHFNKKVYDE